MLQLELCLCCVPHALQSATTVTQPKKLVSASTQTETVFPEGSQETVVHFLVQCISMLSINVFDMITAIFSLAKEMLGLIYPFQSVLVVLSQWLFRHSLCLCKLAGVVDTVFQGVVSSVGRPEMVDMSESSSGGQCQIQRASLGNRPSRKKAMVNW